MCSITVNKTRKPDERTKSGQKALITPAMRPAATGRPHAAELALISGQKPLITKAKKSIAGFRLREGVAIGAKDLR